jgi:hypothetical protein
LPLGLSIDWDGVKPSLEAGKKVGLLDGPGVVRVTGPQVASMPERENRIALTILA